MVHTVSDGLPGPAKDDEFWASITAQSIGIDTPARPVYTPKKLRPRHRAVVMLSEAGLKNKDIAAATGYTQSRVSIILNSRHEGIAEVRKHFASKVADHTLDVANRIKLYADEMLDVMVGHARNIALPENSRMAAKDLMHMAGFTPVKKLLQVNADLPADELKLLMGHLSEANEVVAKAGEWEVHEVKGNGTDG